jgi:hypothetical protein
MALVLFIYLMNAFGETLSEKGCSRNSSTIGSQHSTRMATIGVSSQAKAQKPIKKSFFFTSFT